MKTFTCTTKQTLRDFTDATYPQGSFCLSRLLRDKDVKVNGVRVGAGATLSAGDVVTYYTTPKEEAAPSHEIVYEDSEVLIADKYSGVSAEGLLCELRGHGDYFAVHRLDRNTAGLIVFAKSAAAEKELLRAFKGRGVEKTYLAVCKDCFRSEKATLTAYAVKHTSAALVEVFDAPVSGGKTMITEYRVLERRGGLALVEIRLHTGRTHQIRAHMAHIGCPVLGDTKYGDGALNKKYSAARQRLVAKRIGFSGLGEPLSYLNARIFESIFGGDL